MLNQKGQFSIIAALLVAVVLVASVMATYSSIRYNPVSEQPQIINAVDETNIGFKEILGFTVGYYGSVLKVTGNQTYANELATKYLQSGLDQTGDVRPEWAADVNLTSLSLKINWFSNRSYSQGSMTVTYNLAGLGIYGASYSTSTRLDVEISKANQTGQAQLKILMDDGQPLINLGKNNLKFYRYEYNISDWKPVEPDNIASYSDGTYVLDLPQGIADNSYVIQVEDTRGLMVLASSYSQFTSKLTWNSSSSGQSFDYVDINDTDVIGAHSNFTAQQYGPDSIYDTLTEAASGTTQVPNYPTNYNLVNSTTWSNGPISYLQNNDGNYMRFQSYGSSFNGIASFGCNSISGGQTNTLDTIRGSQFTLPQAGLATSIGVYVDSNSAFKVQAAIYSGDGSTRIAITQESAFSTANGWITLNITTPPILSASTNYVLAAWANSSNVNIHRDNSNNAERFQGSGTYPAWPATIADQSSKRTFSINCTYSPANQYIAQVELVGNSAIPFPWNNLVWKTDSSASIDGVTATFQLCNSTGQYPTSGDGYMTTIIGSGDSTMQQIITTNPANYINSSGYWKVMVTAVKAISTPFDLNLDLIQYSPDVTNYALNLQEQWLNVNASNLRQDLCIKTGNTNGSEPLLVQLWKGGSWQNLTTLTPSYFCNISLAPYIDSSNLTIRFLGSNDLTDPTPNTWNIDAVYIKDKPDISFLLNLQQPTFTLETLQNGTMCWLGQNIQNTTQTLPIPPVPVKAIHVNQTINGINQEVPFQIEDWASNYQIPLGLTSSTTVFGNRQMIVFLLNSQVTDFTIWWDGSDSASQTPLAYTNRYFTDNPGSQTLNNGKLRLQFATNGFVLTSTVGSVVSTSNLMRINNTQDNTDPELSYVITNGVVRDVVLGEAEFSGGIPNCPNTYTNIIISLPANVTYYTYRLRTMFIDSGSRTRAFSDLCPVRVSTNATPTQIQTENGTLGGFPIMQNGTGTFSNYAASSWSAHHFSQLITDAGKGVGVMFTDINNQKLYAFDSFAASTSKGAIKASSGLLRIVACEFTAGSIYIRLRYYLAGRRGNL